MRFTYFGIPDKPGHRKFIYPVIAAVTGPALTFAPPAFFGAYSKNWPLPRSMVRGPLPTLKIVFSPRRVIDASFLCHFGGGNKSVAAPVIPQMRFLRGHNLHRQRGSQHHVTGYETSRTQLRSLLRLAHHTHRRPNGRASEI